MQTDPKAKDIQYIDVRDAKWYRAMTLSERIASLRAAPLIREEVDGILSERRFKRWRAAFGEDDTLFRQRLATDGISEDDLRYLLGESAEVMCSRFFTTPSWLESLSQAFSSAKVEEQSLLKNIQDRIRNQDILSTVKDMPKTWRPVELLTVVEPLIQRGCYHLREGIQALCKARTDLPFDVRTIESLLLPGVCSHLLAAFGRTMVLEINIARLQGQLNGTTPDERFESFIQRMCQPEHAVALLKEYPVLARYAIICIDQWVKHSLEFLHRLCADWGDIRSSFCPQHAPGVLGQLDSGAGDSHQGGQSVMILTFTSGLRLVYKPRPLGIDKHFQSLLTWLNERSSNAYPSFKILNLINREKYGWVEFVANRSCTSREEVQNFYTRQGAYLALLYALEATDFHYENLIAMGEHPILIDLESLFHPHVEQVLAQGSAEAQAGDAFTASVMRVMLLPQRLFSNAESEGIEMSGLGGALGQMTPGRVLRIEWTNLDEMRFTRRYTELPEARNRPKVNEEDVEVQDYQEYIVSGFVNMYRLLMLHRENLLAPAGPLAPFMQDTTRVILRPTQFYARLLQESYHPDLLHNALDRESLFDRLWKDVSLHSLLSKVITVERTELQRGDVPMFSMRLDARDLWTSFDERPTSFFDTSGIELVRDHIQLFSESDLEKQLWFIQASLLTLEMREKEGHWVQHPVSEPILEADHSQLIAAATAIGDRLQELAISGKNDTTWLGLTFVDERHWYLTPLGYDLYHGLSGVILFLAYLGNITGEERYSSLARAAFITLRNQLGLLRSRITAIGFSGWAGVMYTFTHLGILWNDSELLSEAEALVELLPPLIEKDDALDLMSGATGCIAGLISTYQCIPSVRIFETAIKCGERLLATALPMEKGLGWITMDKNSPPLTGFSHGVAGIAWALLKLANLTGQERFRTSALEALVYERSLFSSEARNWPDLRDFGAKDRNPDHPVFSALWCHGAAGIGIARLDSLKYLDDAIIRAEIEAAIETTLVNGFKTNHSLCHGDLGNIELLLQASRVLGPTRWSSEVTKHASYVLQSIKEYGWLCGVPREVETPGLMLGLSGIGYELLRLAEPEKVPSVLVLEPPRVGDCH